MGGPRLTSHNLSVQLLKLIDEPEHFWGSMLNLGSQSEFLAGAFLDKQMSMVMGHDLYYTVLNYEQMS